MTTTNIIDTSVPVSISQGGLGGTNAQDSSQHILYGLFSCKNFLIGGNFDTNPWHRGIFFSRPPNGTWVADMWSWNRVNSGLANVDIDNFPDSPTVAQAGIFSKTCMFAVVDGPETSIDPANYYYLTTRIEKLNVPMIAATATLSFWVRSHVVGTYSVRFRNSTQIYVAEYQVNSQDTWEFKTITIDAPPVQDGTKHFYIDFVIACGLVNLTATFNTWFTSSNIASIHQVNGVGAINNFGLQWVQFENGSVFTGFEIRDGGEELLLAQRYCEMSYPYRAEPGVNTTNGAIFTPVTQENANLNFTKFIPFKVTKPATNHGVEGAIDLYALDGTVYKWDWCDASGNITKPTILYDPGPYAMESTNGFWLRTDNVTTNPQVAAWGHYVARYEF